MKRAIGVALLMVLAVGASGCGRDPVARPGTEIIATADREAMPELAGTTLDGGQAATAQLRGRPVVLNAWASWCAPCREEIPVLTAVAADTPGVQFLGLNVSDEPAAATAFATETGIRYPSIVDPDAALLATIPGIPPKALPSTVVIDAQGRIAARIVGAVTDAGLREILADVSQEPS